MGRHTYGPPEVSTLMEVAKQLSIITPIALHAACMALFILIANDISNFNKFTRRDALISKPKKRLFAVTESFNWVVKGSLKKTIMLKTDLFFLGICLYSSITFGQTFSEKYFIRTNWYSLNADSLFYKADTITMLKAVEKIRWKSARIREKLYLFEEKLLGNEKYVQLGFRPKKILYFVWRERNTFFVPGGRWTWDFEKSSGNVTLYEHGKKVHARFKPVYQKQIKLAPVNSDQDSLMTTKLTLVRVK